MGSRSELDTNFDYEIVDEFLDHYSMMVDSMEIMILDLSKENMKERTLGELFRIFHNIKSASSYLQLEPIKRLASLVEDSLEELRSFNSTVNEETITWLLEVSDMFALWNINLKMDEELSKIKFHLLKIPDFEK